MTKTQLNNTFTRQFVAKQTIKRKMMSQKKNLQSRNDINFPVNCKFCGEISHPPSHISYLLYLKDPNFIDWPGGLYVVTCQDNY